MLRSIFEGFVDLLAPPTCAACEAPIGLRADGFCGGCAPLIDSAPAPPARANDLWACTYGGPLAEAITRLKYAHATEASPALAALLLPQARALAGKVDVLTVVPLHPRRLRQRGYNQSALLGKPVAAAIGARFRPHWLRRVRDTPSQVGASLETRAHQLQGAFAASPRVSGSAVLVIDDVRTTGATFDEARRALLSAGARDVFTLALASTPRPNEP